MEIPAGTTIKFDGGSFAGTTPSAAQFAGATLTTAVGLNSNVEFLSNFTLPLSSQLSLSGGSVSFNSAASIQGSLELNDVAISYDEESETETSVAVSGALSFSSESLSFRLDRITRASGGSVAIQCASAEGTSWSVDELTSAGSVKIAELTCDGAVDAGAVEGDDWDVGSLACDSADVDYLLADHASIRGNANGVNWTINGYLIVLGKADVDDLTTSGYVALGDDATGETWKVGAYLTELAETGNTPTTFNVPTLELNGWTNVSLERVVDLTLWNDGALGVDADLTFVSLTTKSGATIALSNGAILKVATEATFSGTTTLAGKGYFVVPADATTTNLRKLESADARVCKLGAGLSALSAYSTDGANVVATATREDATIPYLTEVLVGQDWILLEAEETDATFTAQAQGRETKLRAFDGEQFITTSVYCAPSHTWLTYVKTVAVQTDVAWKITTDWIMASEYCRALEAIVLRARVEKSETSEPLTSAEVDSISYTCYKRSVVWGKESRSPVEGHENVSVPVNTVFDELVTNDAQWTKDQTGYNWKFEPDTTTNPIFPTPGKYTILVTIKMNEGNPAPIYFEIEAN